MRTARLMTTTFTVAGALGALFACSDSARPLGTMDIVVNDTAGEDASSPAPQAPSTDSGQYSPNGGYGPTVIACAACSCDPTQSYCFSGGASATDGGGVAENGDGGEDGGVDGGDSAHRPAVPLGGAFGEPDGAADAGPPPPPCPMLAAGSAEPGCIPLPTSCAMNPTCSCVLSALQPQYLSCYLDCTPTPGFLSVYCGG
jgi:hypothetical protein